MKYNKNELIELARKADYIETYMFLGKNHKVHTDSVAYIGCGSGNITEIEQLPYNNDGEVDAYVEIMGKNDYSNTLLANTGIEWDDIYEENDKILVVVIF